MIIFIIAHNVLGVTVLQSAFLIIIVLNTTHILFHYKIFSHSMCEEHN